VAGVNKTELLAGGKVKISAKVTPAAPGSAVTLQLKYDDQKKWKTIGHGRLNSHGKVTFKDKISSVRTRKYRVVKPADSRHGAGRGETDKVTVFGWRNLSSVKVATATSFGATGSVTINGVAYPDSLRTYVFSTPGTASIDYNLNRDCKAFRGTVGLEDSSPTNGSAQVSLSADGAQKYSGAFTLTQSAPVTLDLTHVFRLSISASLANGGVAALGTPQVLCSF
jgi:hypothetical protein